jgi:hypothetical protein
MADEETTVEEDAPAAPAVEEPPLAEEAPALEGHKLDEMGGAQVGKIEGRMSGTSAGSEWLVARMGRFGHYCLVPSRDAVSANGRVWVPYTRDQIRRAPRVEPKAPLDGELEQAVLAHYGLN